MEIGPVPGVRAVSLLNVQRPESAQPPVFEIDPAARADDETYSASRQTPTGDWKARNRVGPKTTNRELKLRWFRAQNPMESASSHEQRRHPRQPAN